MATVLLAGKTVKLDGETIATVGALFTMVIVIPYVAVEPPLSVAMVRSWCVPGVKDEVCRE